MAFCLTQIKNDVLSKLTFKLDFHLTGVRSVIFLSHLLEGSKINSQLDTKTRIRLHTYLLEWHRKTRLYFAQLAPLLIWRTSVLSFSSSAYEGHCTAEIVVGWFQLGFNKVSTFYIIHIISCWIHILNVCLYVFLNVFFFCQPLMTAPV